MRIVWKLCCCSLLLSGTVAGQDVRGTVDLHIHADPDSLPRSIDAIEAARMAASHRMRAIVLKSHYEPTASLAWLVQKVVPGIGVYGGIDLNRSVGGINPEAVERMTRMKGGLGRIVWMPTFDAENQVRYSKEDRPFVAVSRNGALLPEVLSVLDLIAKHQLTLATGHSTPAEVLMLIREGRRRGVERILVTHGMSAPVLMNVSQMQEAAGLGAFIEFVYGDQLPVNEIRATGPARIVLSSDLGQVGRPLPPQGLASMLKTLKQAGFSDSELHAMTRDNPARVLGLPAAR
jgi:hypothetical protein